MKLDRAARPLVALVAMALAVLGTTVPASAATTTGYVLDFDGLDAAIPLTWGQVSLAAAGYDGDPGFEAMNDLTQTFPASVGDYKLDLRSDYYEFTPTTFSVVEGEVTHVPVHARTTVDLRGSVRYNDGDPASLPVTAKRETDGATFTEWSNAEGQFWFTDLAAGGYTVSTDIGYGVTSSSVVVAENDASVVELGVAEGGVIVGHASYGPGLAIPQVLVLARDHATGKAVANSYAAQDGGAFRLGGLTDGLYDLEFRGSPYRQVGHASVNLAHGYATLPDVVLPLAAVVTGAVTPAAGTSVGVYPIGASTGFGSVIANDGTFTIGSLTPGRYILWISGGDELAPVLREIDLPVGVTSAGRITLTAGKPLTGTVAHRDGSVAGNASVTAAQVDCTTGNLVTKFAHTPTTTATTAGAFSLPGMPDTCYDLTTSVDGGTVALRRVRAGSGGLVLRPAPLPVKPVATTISSRTTSTTYGTAAKVAVSVTRTGGVTGSVSGRVALLDGSRRLASAALVSGKASFTLSRTTSVGSHRYTVAFEPSAGFTSSTTTVTLKVGRAKPTVSVSASHVKRGSKAHVKVLVKAGTSASGTVTLKVGSHTIAKKRLSRSGSAYVAKVTVSVKDKGRLSVKYNGSATLLPVTVRTKYVAR